MNKISKGLFKAMPMINNSLDVLLYELESINRSLKDTGESDEQKKRRLNHIVCLHTYRKTV